MVCKHNKGVIKMIIDYDRCVKCGEEIIKVLKGGLKKE